MYRLNGNNILTLGLIVSFFLCSWISLRIAGYLWKPKRSRHLPCIIGATTLSIVIYLCNTLQNEPMAYIINFVVTLLIMLSCFHISLLPATVASIFSVFHTMCLKGILTGVASLLLQKNMYQVLSVERWSQIIMISVAVCKIILILQYRRTVSSEKMKIFFSSKQEVQNVCCQHLALLIFLLFYSYNYYYNLDLIWFSFAQMLISGLMLVIYCMILSYGVKVSNLVQRDLWNQHLTEQMKNRLANYRSYQSIYGEIRSFEHQFKEMSLSAQYLLDKGDLQRLSNLFTGEYPKLLSTLPHTTQFSNESSCDAVLFEWNSICTAENIAFDANLFIPEDSSLNASYLHGVLQLLWDVSFPLAQAGSEKASITLSSKVAHNWLTIKIQGTYGGSIKTRKNLPYFLVKDGTDVEIKSAYLHLNDYVTAQGAMISYSVDAARKLFSISVSMHYNE